MSAACDRVARGARENLRPATILAHRFRSWSRLLETAVASREVPCGHHRFDVVPGGDRSLTPAMPTSSARYQSLPAQVAARLAEAIEQGAWGTWLPGERALAKSMQVGRKTLRKALSQLQRDGALETRHGLGHRIVSAARPGAAARAAGGSVGLLTPESLENLRPFTALWVDELRSLLFEGGVKLEAFSGQRFFTARPDKALGRLLEQHPQTCWILAHSHEPIQRWFHEGRIACVVAGSPHPGLSLPNVDLDYAALCRHATGEMARRGHRRVVLFTRQSQRAGDLETERGFDDGIRGLPHPEIISSIVRHDGTVEGAYRALARIFNASLPPTAMLVAQSAFYLTTVSFLAERGLRVGEDVSLVSRDDESFLAYLRPVPARYSCNPNTYAKRLLQQLRLVLDGNAAHATQRIEPRFLPGASLGSGAPRE